MLTGDWDKVKKMLSEFGSRLQAEADKATAENLQLVEKTVVGHIDKQDLNWAPLSKNYARYKARTRSAKWRRKRLKGGKSNPRRLSEKTLVATSAMRNAITSYRTSPYSGETGISRRKSYADGEKMVNIMLVQELGTKDKKIPARKLWEPSAKEVEGKIVKRFSEAVEKALNV